jgi:hypothetical protein
VKLFRVLLPLAVMAFGFFVVTTEMQATPEMAKKEKTACKTCHVTPKEKPLNDVGKCYKTSKDLKTCKS